WSIKSKSVVVEYYINNPRCVAYSTNGEFLAAGGESNIYIWNAKEFKEQEEITQLFFGLDSVDSIIITDKNDIIARGNKNGEIKCWTYDLTQPKPTWVLKWTSR